MIAEEVREEEYALEVWRERGRAASNSDFFWSSSFFSFSDLARIYELWNAER